MTSLNEIRAMRSLTLGLTFLCAAPALTAQTQNLVFITNAPVPGVATPGQAGSIGDGTDSDDTRKVVVFDVDFDGDEDVLFLNHDGFGRGLLNDGFGAFTVDTASADDLYSCTAGVGAKGVAVGDADGDGDADVFIATGPVGGVQQANVWLANSPGPFTNFQDVSAFQPAHVDHSYDAAFLQLDGMVALAVANRMGGGVTGQNRLYVDSNLDGVFETVAPSGGEFASDQAADVRSSRDLVVADFDGDGLDDVFVAKSTAPDGMLLSELMLPTGDRDSSDIRSGKWVIGTMAPNESRTISVMGSATGPGVISSCTQASYDRSMCMVTTVVQPGLQLELMAPAEVLVCDDIVVMYRLCNPGTGDATNVKVSAAYPEGLVDADGSKMLNKTFPKLAPGQCEEFSVALTAEKAGNYTHVGMAKADADLSSNARNMNTIVRQPELRIECAKAKDVFVGRQGSNSITVSNVGDYVSANTVLRARMSDNMGFIRASNNGMNDAEKSPDLVTWNLGDLAPGQSVTVNMTLRTLDIGTAEVTARAEGVCAPEVACSTEADIKGIPAVLLEVVDENDPVVVGENEIYTITATNQGSAEDTNIRIVGILTSNTQFVSASGATTGTLQGNRVVFEPLASLDPDDDAVWKIVVKSVSAGNVRFRVTMHTDQLGATPVEETEATNFYE